MAKYGMISAPPFVTINTSTASDVYADFDIVAKALGCDYGDDYEAELQCMRHISWVQIEEYINRYNATPAIAFSSYIGESHFPASAHTEDSVLMRADSGREMHLRERN